MSMLIRAGKKSFGVWMIAISLLLTLSACGTSGGTNGGAASGTAGGKDTTVPAAKPQEPAKEVPKELPTINVAYMPDIHGATPIVLGEEKGYFKEAGVKINAVKFLSGPPEFQAMAAGDIDIAYIGPGATFLSAQGKGNIIAVDSLNTGDMVYATKKSGIKDWKDLKGKTVGVPKGTSGEMILNLGIKKGGLKPEDVNAVNMDVAGAVSAFVAGKVDAVAIWSPYTSEIEKQVGKDNIVKLGDNKMFFPEYVFPQSWVVNPKFLKEKPELVEKFLAAWVKANDYRIKNIEETIKLTAKYTQVPEDSLKVQVDTTEWIESKKQVDYFKDGTVIKWYENLEKLFVENGKLTEVVKGDTFVSPAPFLKVVK
ncbi:ABC transporter substrate-binding protein [Paenibacillus radicis (ex Xue et al. 2023)]|uniref:Aliphatic sulfonate ABC transporter substrate-binding protein n=1 Tax=Paenibacillus radicis (ex Xue et al. 2023) TaxID=2972489 RepID=A0ABT1YAB6_9BACL|nr:aliphatic sulfonate ABC transporter substrate-binding protein [Paenibacillus radicis (ex Xue et al. 2023)]MCR8629720.1 aliphatic sulfonate ABC transporter substrate-binding protein [Paenibacillus radicis (ex Xue et al. 2023)]